MSAGRDTPTWQSNNLTIWLGSGDGGILDAIDDVEISDSFNSGSISMTFDCRRRGFTRWLPLVVVQTRTMECDCTASEWDENWFWTKREYDC